MVVNLLDILPVGVWVLDSELRVEAVNLRIQEFFGIPREELIGRDKRALVTSRIHTIFENGADFLRRILATYDQNTYSENFLCHVMPADNRQERWLEHFSQPIRRDDLVVGRVEVYFDVTDRIQYEQELNWISTQFIQVQEREKARIASNLHNDVGQSVIALKLSLEQVQGSLQAEGNEQGVQQVTALVGQVEGIARQISQISRDLLPPELNFGIEDTLDWMRDYYRSLYDLKVDVQVLGLNHKRFQPEIEIALFRVFQEGLNNVVKHAHTRDAQCRLIYTHPRLTAIVQDNGAGFDSRTRSFGAGLRIMQRRVAELGGSLTVKSEPGAGTQVRVVIPTAMTHDGHGLNTEEKQFFGRISGRFPVEAR